MPFTPPNFQPAGPTEGNPLNAILSGLLKGVQAAPDFYTSVVKAKYAPLTVQADALSKLAYSNLAGPQYIAKLLENPAVAAQFTEEQKRQLLQLATQPPMNLANINQGITSNISNQLKGGQGNISQPQPINPQNTSPVQLNNTNLNPTSQTTPTNLYTYDKNGNNVTASPQEISDLLNKQKPGQAVTNTSDQSVDIPTTTTQPEQNTWSENQAKQQAIVKQGEEAGTLRAKAIDDIGEEMKGLLTNKDSINLMGEVLKNPLWQRMRSEVPTFQKEQLSALKKLGTPEEQELIGTFTSDGNKMIQNSLNSFKGNSLKADIPIASDMKINDNDTWNVAAGKFQSIALMNELQLQRDQAAAKLMDKPYYLNKNAALEQADKMVHGDAIRSQIESMIYPSVVIDGQTYIQKNGKFYKRKG